MNPNETPPATPNTNIPSNNPSPQQVSQPSIERLPSTWPGAFGIIKYAFAAVRLNVGMVLLAVLMYLGLGYVFSVISSPLVSWIPTDTFAGQTLSSMIESLIGVLPYSLLLVLLTLAYIAGIRGQRVSIGGKLSEGFSLLLKMVVLQLLIYLTIFIGLLLLVVPGVIMIGRLWLAEYYLVDKKLGIIESYKASLAATKIRSNRSKVWGVIGVNLLIVLLVITVIGILFVPFLLVIYGAATAALYEHINRTPQVSSQQKVSTNTQN